MAIQTKAGENIQMECVLTRAYHQYKLFGYMGSNFSSLIVKPYLITLSDEADVFPTFQHAGIETIYMLESEVDYRHGDNVYQLKPGNTLFF